MDEAEARSALEAATGRHFESVLRIEGGWSFRTFLADGLIVRFPVTDNDARLLGRELRLLPELAPRLAVAIPRYELTGEWGGRPFGGYHMLPGREASLADFEGGSRVPAVLGQALEALHTFPVERAYALLDEQPGESWRGQLAFFEHARRDAFPLLPDDVRAVAERELQWMIAIREAEQVRLALAHNDLGLVHLLVDDDGALTGIIDWSDMEVRDPAIDFVGVFGASGWPAVERILAGYGRPPGPHFRERVHFYAWVSPLHDILYGQSIGDAEIIADGVAGVSRRMAITGLR